MAFIEHTNSDGMKNGRFFPTFMLGRVVPHVLIIAYIMFFLSRAVSTVHTWLVLFVVSYALFASAHTYGAYRKLRYPLVLVLTLGLSLLFGVLAHLLAPSSEAGSYIAGVHSFFLLILLWYSAINNYWFVRWRLYYIVELLLLNVVWIVLVVTGEEASTTALITLSLPILAYGLYVLLLDYAFAQRMEWKEKQKIFVRYLLALGVLLLGLFIGSLAGVGDSDRTASQSYSMLSKQNNLFKVQDRAKLEDEFKLPLDSKELVFIANIDPVVTNGMQFNIGYYLKFHSLYNFDPVGMEFNSVSDELEDPDIRLRTVPLDKTREEPVHVAMDRDGRPIVPRYELRVDGKTTVYNVKLNADENFGPNLTYRFVSYPSHDSISVGDQTYRQLGIYKLFTKVSLLNLIPIGTAGELFQFDFNHEVLKKIDQYHDLDKAPRYFLQQYLNTTGLEADILDTARAIVRDARTYSEKISAVIGFFTRKNAEGKNLFMYDLKPGKPEHPDESLLHYFLFTSHRGYCTYYATAATLFLRAAGIPARVAVGFVPGESSEQNPGWYYVYSIQAHAWTEVYLGPSLGWIDLDLTPVGENSDAPPPPPPTPPTPPLPVGPQYELHGTVTQTGYDLRCGNAMVKKIEEAMDLPICPGSQREIFLRFDATLDSAGTVSKERRSATEVIRTLQRGDSIVIRGKVLSNPTVEGCTFSEFAFFKIHKIEKQKSDSTATKKSKINVAPWWKLVWPYSLFASLVLFILFSAPSIHLFLLRSRMRSQETESYLLRNGREWILLSLHMHGVESDNETDAEFAVRMEREHGLLLAPFFEKYIAFRYAGQVHRNVSGIAKQTEILVHQFLCSRFTVFVRLLHHLYLWRYLRFVNRRKTV